MALDVARATGGAVINADSMQVYSVLKVLTARPGADDLAVAPHYLYGHMRPDVHYSTGDWLRDVGRLIASGELAGRRLIFVGGTGLYFRALTGGLAAMPAIPKDVRDAWRARLAERGPGRLHAELARRDPKGAARIGPADGQRIVRALEVVDHTGLPIGHWQSRKGQALVDMASARAFAIAPERPVLHSRINERFDRMVEAGAPDEVRDLLALGIPASMPAMKAIGVQQLAAALAGTLSTETAVEQAKAATRQYAKRQMTWFKNQLGAEWQSIQKPQDAETVDSLFNQ